MSKKIFYLFISFIFIIILTAVVMGEQYYFPLPCGKTCIDGLALRMINPAETPISLEVSISSPDGNSRHLEIFPHTFKMLK